VDGPAGGEGLVIGVGGDHEHALPKVADLERTGAGGRPGGHREADHDRQHDGCCGEGCDDG